MVGAGKRRAMSVQRYERVSEPADAVPAPVDGRSLKLDEVERELAASELTEGGRNLVRGPCRLG
jgi:hypothetical protein